MASKVSYIEFASDDWGGFIAIADTIEAQKTIEWLESNGNTITGYFPDELCVFDSAQEVIAHDVPMVPLKTSNDKYCEKPHWGIAEFHNGILNNVYAPYDSQMEAFEHIDKLKAYRKENPNPIEYDWQAMHLYQPSYVG